MNPQFWGYQRSRSRVSAPLPVPEGGESIVWSCFPTPIPSGNCGWGRKSHPWQNGLGSLPKSNLGSNESLWKQIPGQQIPPRLFPQNSCKHSGNGTPDKSQSQIPLGLPGLTNPNSRWRCPGIPELPGTGNGAFPDGHGGSFGGAGGALPLPLLEFLPWIFPELFPTKP